MLSLTSLCLPAYASSGGGLDVMGLNAYWPYGKTLFAKEVANNSDRTLFLKAKLYSANFTKANARGKEKDTPLTLNEQVMSISLLNPELIVPPHQKGYFRMVMPSGYIKSNQDNFYRLSIENDVAAQKSFEKNHGIKQATQLGIQVTLGYMVALIVPASHPNYGHVSFQNKNHHLTVTNNDNSVVRVDFAGTCSQAEKGSHTLCPAKGYFSVEHLIYPHQSLAYSTQHIHPEVRVVVKEGNNQQHHSFSS
ncbi:hypothetical protein [Dongshaea marina]|uniref:hypothetical protein n=1 Tax=Dongshaea marina TaxID=2047966 RepID=UPI00131F405A|nr:hypothetical protein [Dongshaea marina]